MDEREFDEFEEKLKKAFERDSGEEPEETNVDAKNMAIWLTNMVKMGSMVELAKAANARITTLVDELVEELSKLNKKDQAKHHAKAIFAIKKASKEIDILHTIVTASTITGVALIGDADESYEEILNTIVRAIAR